MTVLVTGATGFIGRRLVRRLIETHGAASIVCLVKAPATPLEAEALESYRAMGMRLIDGDLLDGPCAPSRRRVSTSCSTWPRTSTRTRTRTSSSSTTRARATCSIGSRPSREARGSCTRARWRSTIATRLRRRRLTNAARSCPGPRTARPSCQGEEILRGTRRADGYSWTILRLPTVYGPGRSPAASSTS